MMVSASYELNSHFPRNTDAKVYTIYLLTPQGAEEAYARHANIGSNSDEREKVTAWLRCGAILAANNGFSKASVKDAIHAWRMKHDLIYRFVKLKCVENSGRLTTDEFCFYFQEYLLKLGITKLYEKSEITAVLAELGFTNEPRTVNGVSTRCYLNIDVSEAFRLEVATSSRSKMALDDEFDRQQRSER